MARRLVRDDIDDYDDDLEDDIDPLDDEEEEERPARRAARSQTRRGRDAAEERPSFRRAAESDSKPAVGRRVRSSADEGDRPSRARSAPSRDVLGHGFGSYKSEAAKRKTGYKTLEIPEGGRKKKIIKILEPEPITHYYQHWIARAQSTERTGKAVEKRRPYVCLGSRCPLCGIGDVAKPVMLWNVVDLEDGQVKVWVLSKDPASRLEERYDEAEESDREISDFNLYYAVSKKKQDNGITAYKVDVVKRRDVQEEYDIEPLDQDEIDDLLTEAYTDSIVYIPTVAELQTVANEADD